MCVRARIPLLQHDPFSLVTYKVIDEHMGVCVSDFVKVITVPRTQIVRHNWRHHQRSKPVFQHHGQQWLTLARAHTDARARMQSTRLISIVCVVLCCVSNIYQRFFSKGSDCVFCYLTRPIDYTLSSLPPSQWAGWKNAVFLWMKLRQRLVFLRVPWLVDRGRIAPHHRNWRHRGISEGIARSPPELSVIQKRSKDWTQRSY